MTFPVRLHSSPFWSIGGKSEDDSIPRVPLEGDSLLVESSSAVHDESFLKETVTDRVRNRVSYCELFENQEVWEKVHLPLLGKIRAKLYSLFSDVEIPNGYPEQFRKILTKCNFRFIEGQFHLIEHTVDSNEMSPEICIRTCQAIYALGQLSYRYKQDYQYIHSIFLIYMKPYVAMIEQLGNSHLTEYCRMIMFDFLNYYSALYRHKNYPRFNYPLSEIDAATILQRAFRRKGYINDRKSFQYKPLSEERLKTFLSQVNYSYKLPFPKFPQESNPVQKEKAKEWIEAHSWKLQPTAQKFIKVLTHRSFAQFTKGLQLSIESFNRKLMSMPIEKRDFVIILACNSENKSNPWVTALALPSLAKKPVDIITKDQYSAFREENPQVRLAVLFDDAAYSGKQMETFLSSITFFQPHLVIPFMTTSAHNRFRCTSSIWIADHERMLAITELSAFDAEELKILKELTGDYDHGNLFNRTLTWFDHKIADDLSTLDSVLSWGRLLDGTRGGGYRFIQLTVPPYSSRY